uniref:Pleckstrin homology domain-containing family A member 3-like n=2 Tax=Hirondellea gigas TaxID=1518452 RepID=A0A2P2I662_9CRUS
MEGILYKWTNYWNGWQPRWFVLTDGELTYYKSEEEVSLGCKGSVKLCACQIIVHPTDSLRVDVVIPYEQRFCLKAPSQMQRHAWLVALGNAKAGLPPFIQHFPLPPASESGELKAKRSELRLTCDLLMKQVYDLKMAATAEGGPNMQGLDDASGLLSATCDSFCTALDDCMKLSRTPTLPSPDSAPPSPPLILIKGKRSSISSIRRSSLTRLPATDKNGD